MEAPRQWLESCDYINNLPDSILHHILSFLPIKDVIRTSFISRRWRYMWTSVPTLHFDGLVFSPKTKFMNFVNSVFSHRDNCGLQKFYLRFGGYYCTSVCVHSWILAAINQNVRELGLSSYAIKLFELPDQIFTCRSLRVLTLNSNHSVLKLPSNIYLPFLETLQLVSLTFSEDSLTQLLSSCPVLENVLIEDCLLEDVKVLHVSSLSLRRLTIDGLPKDLSSGNSGIENEVKILAPKLSSFEYKDYFTRSISVENLSLLMNAFIDFDFDSNGREKICGSHAINLLKGLANVEVLVLSSGSIKLLSAAPSFLMQLPTFSNLKHLKLSLEVSCSNIGALTYILHVCPYLELLSVELSHRRQFFYKDEVFDPVNSGSVINHLKIVKIRGFTGDKKDLVFVKYLLEHACTLERMTIVSSKHFLANTEWQMKIKGDILMHTRSSANSEVIFTHWSAD